MAEDDDFDIDAWVEVRFFNILKLGFLFSSKSGFGCLILGLSGLGFFRFLVF